MPIESRMTAMVMKRKRLIVDGMPVGALSGLDFDPNVIEVSRDVYGDVDGISMATYGSGPQSVDIIEDPNSPLVNEMFAGIPDRDPTTPVLARAGSGVTPRFAIVETLNEDHNGYANGSTYLGSWAAVFGTARNDPAGEAVRTIRGNAGVPLECLEGGQFLSRRVTLSSGGGGWTGTWTNPVPLLIPQKSDHYAVYLEIQHGDGYDRVAQEIAVDDTNVDVAKTITIPHTDVIDAGFGGATGTEVSAWVIFLHGESALQTHEYRWGA